MFSRPSFHDEREAARLLARRALAFKACTCCERFYETAADFEKLPMCGSGYQPQYDDEGDERTDVRLSLRNCVCRTTLCVEVSCERCVCGQFIGPEHALVMAYGVKCCPTRLAAIREDAMLDEAARRRGLDPVRERAYREAVSRYEAEEKAERLVDAFLGVES